MAAVGRPAPRALVRDEAAATASIPASPRHKTEPRLTAAPANSSQLLDSLRTQLRAQSVDIDRLEAENSEQRAAMKDLHTDLDRLQAAQRIDAQDLVHLASRLLALAQTAGVEFDNSTKALFRRRGWTVRNGQDG